jgi:hypothetical protein
MAQMGWRSDAMFRRYGVVDRGNIRAALERTQQHERDNQHGHNLGHNELSGTESEISRNRVSAVN